LAWGQIGVSESSNPSDSAPISDRIVNQFYDAASQTSDPPCFLIKNRDGSSHCLLDTTPVPDSNPALVEIRVLLPELLNNLESWQTYLRTMDVTGAELSTFENQDNTLARGGSAAGNLVWLIQSIGNTYSRTRELLQVSHFPSITHVVECSYY
jgi:hypothetical protein